MVENSNDIEIFDRSLLSIKRQRAVENFSNYDFLFSWTKENLQDRLSIIQRDFETIIQLGSRGGALMDNAFISDCGGGFSADFIAHEDMFPFAPNSLDCVISALSLHSVNDLPGALLQIRQALKPDGLFIAALFGGETLYELRQCLSHVEMESRGGLSPRIFPFADKQELGALLQRAGFALPVVDSEIVKVSYEHIFKLMEDLRGMGESNIIKARDKSFVGKDFFMKSAQHYAENFALDNDRIEASFEIIFLIGWSPDASQQQPLKPGSAQNRLADALKTEETKL
ncbi:MAG: methyltransferase domain-containing protein [Bdellovibrionales bacterium]